MRRRTGQTSIKTEVRWSTAGDSDILLVPPSKMTTLSKTCLVRQIALNSVLMLFSMVEAVTGLKQKIDGSHQVTDKPQWLFKGSRYKNTYSSMCVCGRLMIFLALIWLFSNSSWLRRSSSKTELSFVFSRTERSLAVISVEVRVSIVTVASSLFLSDWWTTWFWP